ncbi:hypothetical protein WN943_021292 [Citrus x changshan-huyou]
MKELNRSFKLRRGSSKKIAKSMSFLLLSESASTERSSVTGYKRLSESVRNKNKNNESACDIISSNGTGNGNGSSCKRSTSLGFMKKVFSFRKVSNANDDGMKEKLEVTASTEEDKKIKRKSNWLSTSKKIW